MGKIQDLPCSWAIDVNPGLRFLLWKSRVFYTEMRRCTSFARFPLKVFFEHHLTQSIVQIARACYPDPCMPIPLQGHFFMSQALRCALVQIHRKL